MRRNGRHHVGVGLGGDFQRRDEVVRQLADIATLMLVQAPGVVLDRVFLQCAVRHALLAVVGPGEGRFDAIGGIVGEGQRNGTGRRDRQQVRITQAVLADFCLDLVRQAGGKIAARQVELGVEQREGTAFLGQLDGVKVGCIAHLLGDAGGHRTGFGFVVAQAQHGQRVAEAGEAEADAALVGGFLRLALERPVRRIEDVVQHAGGDTTDFGEGVEVEAGGVGEGVADKQRQVDRTQAAAAIRRQRLFGAGVGRLDNFAVIEVVVLVHPVEEQDARFSMVIGGLHHLIPQIAGADLAVHPHAILALVSAGIAHVSVGLGAMDEFDIRVSIDRFHEAVGHADRDVEIGQVAMVLGVNEILDIRMVAAQHAHLGAAAGAGGFDGLAGAVEDAHVGDRAGGA